MAYKHELAIRLLTEAMDTYAEAYDLEEVDEIYAIMANAISEIGDLVGGEDEDE